MGHGASAALLERQTRLGSIECLHLTFLVATEYDGVFRNVQVEPDDVLQLLGKVRIVGDFEGARQVRFEPVFTPNPTYRARAHVQGLYEGPLAPVRRLRRMRPKRFVHDELSDLRPVGGLASASRSIRLNPCTSTGAKALAPAPLFVALRPAPPPRSR